MIPRAVKNVQRRLGEPWVALDRALTRGQVYPAVIYNYMKKILTPVLCIIFSLFVLNSCIRTLAFSRNQVENLARIKKIGILTSLSNDDLKTYDIEDIRRHAYAPVGNSGQTIDPLAVVAAITVAEIISDKVIANHIGDTTELESNLTNVNIQEHFDSCFLQNIIPALKKKSIDTGLITAKNYRYKPNNLIDLSIRIKKAGPSLDAFLIVSFSYGIGAIKKGEIQPILEIETLIVDINEELSLLYHNKAIKTITSAKSRKIEKYVEKKSELYLSDVCEIAKSLADDTIFNFDTWRAMKIEE